MTLILNFSKLPTTVSCFIHKRLPNNYNMPSYAKTITRDL